MEKCLWVTGKEDLKELNQSLATGWKVKMVTPLSKEDNGVFVNLEKEEEKIEL